MKVNKKAFKVVTVVVSAALLINVIRQMSLSDRVVLTSGEVVSGEIVNQTAQGVVIRRTGTSVKAEPDLLAADMIREVKGKPDVRPGLWTVLKRLNPWWFMASVLLFAIPPLGGAVRWKILLKTQGVTLTHYEATSLTFIGYFFNYMMPGLTGGDVLKAYYVSRRTQRKTVAVLSVFMDRVIGLISLALLAVAIVLVKLGDANWEKVIIPVVLFGWLGFVGLVVLLSRKLRRHFPETLLAATGVGGAAILGWWVVMKGVEATRTPAVAFTGVMLALGVVTLLVRLFLWERLKNMLGRSRIVREMDDSFHVYRKSPGVMTLVFVISFVVHGINIVGVYAQGKALGIDLGLWTYMLLVPVIIMISSIPISVAGLGWQENAFQWFFGLSGVGVTANVAGMLAFLFRICGSFILVVPGYVFLVLWRDRPAMKSVEEMMDSETEAG